MILVKFFENFRFILKIRFKSIFRKKKWFWFPEIRLYKKIPKIFEFFWNFPKHSILVKTLESFGIFGKFRKISILVNV